MSLKYKIENSSSVFPKLKTVNTFHETSCSNLNNFKKQSNNRHNFRKLFLDWLRKKKFRSIKKDANSDVRYEKCHDFPTKGCATCYSKEKNETMNKQPSIRHYNYSGNLTEKENLYLATESLMSYNKRLDSPLSDHNFGMGSSMYKISSKMLDVSSSKSMGPKCLSSSALFTKRSSKATSTSLEFDDVKSFWIYPTNPDKKIMQDDISFHLHNMKLVEQLDVFGDIIKNLLINVSSSRISMAKQGQIRQSYKTIINKISALIDDKDELTINLEKGIQVESSLKLTKTHESVEIIQNDTGDSKLNRSLNDLLSDCSPFQSMIDINYDMTNTDQKIENSSITPRRPKKYNRRSRNLTNGRYQKYVLKSWKIFKTKLESNKIHCFQDLDSVKYELNKHIKKINREVKKSNFGKYKKSQIKLLVNEIMLNYISLSLHETINHENKFIDKEKKNLVRKSSPIQEKEIALHNELDVLLESKTYSNEKERNLLYLTSTQKSMPYQTEQIVYLNEDESKVESEKLMNSHINVTGDYNNLELRLFQRQSIYDVNLYGMRKSPLKIEVTESEIPYNPIVKKLEGDAINCQEIVKWNQKRFNKFDCQLVTDYHKNQLRKAKSNILYTCRSETVSEFDAEVPTKEVADIISCQNIDNNRCSKLDVIEDNLSSSYSHKISRTENINFLISKLNSMIMSSPIFLRNIQETMKILKSHKKRSAHRVVKSFLDDNFDDSDPIIQLDNLKSIELWDNYLKQLFKNDSESFDDSEMSYVQDSNSLSSDINRLQRDLINSQKVTKILPYSSVFHKKKKPNSLVKPNMKYCRKYF